MILDSTFAFIRAKKIPPRIARLKTLASSPADLWSTEINAFDEDLRGMEPELRQLEETNRKAFCESVVSNGS